MPRIDRERVEQRSFNAHAHNANMERSSHQNMQGHIFRGERESSSFESSHPNFSSRVWQRQEIASQRINKPPRGAQRPLEHTTVFMQPEPPRAAQRPLNGRSQTNLHLFQGTHPVEHRPHHPSRYETGHLTNLFRRFLTPSRCFTYSYWFPRRSPTVEIHIGSPVAVVGQNALTAANHHKKSGGLLARIALVASSILMGVGFYTGSLELFLAGSIIGFASLMSLSVEGEEDVGQRVPLHNAQQDQHTTIAPVAQFVPTAPPAYSAQSNQYSIPTASPVQVTPTAIPVYLDQDQTQPPPYE